MLIRAYGLFWSAYEVEWFPGAGSCGRYMLLGRRGERKPKLQLADFRTQSGLYILYGNYGPYYVGKADRLGRRLKQYLNDRHAGKWNRLSWFGFRPLLPSRYEMGVSRLKEPRQKTRGPTPQAIPVYFNVYRVDSELLDLLSRRLPRSIDLAIGRAIDHASV